MSTQKTYTPREAFEEDIRRYYEAGYTIKRVKWDHLHQAVKDQWEISPWPREFKPVNELSEAEKRIRGV